MNIKAYRLSDLAVMLRPATEASNGGKINPALDGELAMTHASAAGLEFALPGGL